MTERFRFLRGDFAACGRQGSSALRGGFLSGRPERNQRGARARLRMSASRSYSPPLDPILRRLPLEVGRTFPARKIRSAWVRFLPGHWALGLWKIGVGAVPLLRLPFPNQRPEAVFRRRGAQCAPAGRSGTGPYAETDAFPDTPQGQVSSPARRRQRSSCRGGYQPPETARWGHRALQKSKHVFGYAAGTAPCACPSQKICHVGRGCVPAAPWGCSRPKIG